MAKKRKRKLRPILNDYGGVRKSDVVKELAKSGQVKSVKTLKTRGSLESKSTKQLKNVEGRLYEQAKKNNISVENVRYHTVAEIKMSKNGKKYYKYTKVPYKYANNEQGKKAKRDDLIRDIKTLATNIELNIHPGQNTGGRGSPVRQAIGAIQWKREVREALQVYETKTGRRFSSEGNRSIYQMLRDLDSSGYSEFFEFVAQEYPDQVMTIFDMRYWRSMLNSPSKEDPGETAEYAERLGQSLEEVAVLYTRFRKWQKGEEFE